MRRQQATPKTRFKRHLIVGRPTDLASMSFDDLYNEISDSWEKKAKQLQARRWRRIRHQVA